MTHQPPTNFNIPPRGLINNRTNEVNALREKIAGSLNKDAIVEASRTSAAARIGGVYEPALKQLANVAAKLGEIGPAAEKDLGTHFTQLPGQKAKEEIAVATTQNKGDVTRG